MNNLAIILGKEEDINLARTNGINELIIGVKDLSIYPYEMDIDDIIALSNDFNITIAINRMIHNSSLDLVRKVLEKVRISKIKKILFYDLGIYKISQDLNIKKELVISQEHLNASTKSNLFYYKKGIKNSFISSDITYEEVLDIKEKSKMKIYYTVYGYLPIFYSRRLLLSNYFKYIKKDMKDNTYYITNNDLRYMIKEYSYGTIIYSPLVNLSNKVHLLKDIDYLVIDLSYCDDKEVISKFILNRDTNNYIGFFDEKTIYKVKEEDK